MQTGTAITDYTYTADDRLAGVDQGLREVSYEYDGLGRALTETVRSLLVLQSETEQVWDGMVVVAQSSAAGTTSLVRDVLGDVALQSTPGLLGSTDSRWGLTDRLGSTIGQAQGSKVGQLAEYSDWGVPTFGTLGWNSETGYTGELGDTTSGLVNFYARSYDPMAGSWLSADPYRGTLTDPQSLNRYGYVTGNPTTFTDAYGYAVTGRMLHDSSGGWRAARIASLARQEAAMVNRLDPTGSKRDAAAGPVCKEAARGQVEICTPSAASTSTARHECTGQGRAVSCGGPLSSEAVGAGLLIVGGILLVVGGIACVLATVGICGAGIAVGVGGGAAQAGGGVIGGTTVAISGTAIGGAAVVAGAAALGAGASVLHNERDNSVEPRDVHGELRSGQRDVDVEYVQKHGDLYYQQDGQLVRVLSNGDDTYSVVIRDASNPTGKPTTVFDDLTEAALQRKIASGEWW